MKINLEEVSTSRTTSNNRERRENPRIPSTASILGRIDPVNEVVKRRNSSGRESSGGKPELRALLCRKSSRPIANEWNFLGTRRYPLCTIRFLSISTLRFDEQKSCERFPQWTDLNENIYTKVFEHWISVNSSRNCTRFVRVTNLFHFGARCFIFKDVYLLQYLIGGKVKILSFVKMLVNCHSV